MWPRTGHRLLPRRLLPDRPGGPGQPHDLRRCHLRVPRSPAPHRERPQYSKTAVPISRSVARRQVVRNRSQLVAGSPRRCGVVRGAGRFPRAGSRDRAPGGTPRARRRCTCRPRFPRGLAAPLSTDNGVSPCPRGMEARGFPPPALAWHLVGRAGEDLPATASLFAKHLVGTTTPRTEAFRVAEAR